MKKLFAAAGIGVAVALGSLLGAGAANATPEENTMVLQGLSNKGWVIWDYSLLLQQANQVCSDIDNIPGWTGLSERQWLFNHTSYSWSDAGQLVDSAVYNICPEFLPGGSQNQGYLA